jgi:hypothetical protein
LGGENEFSKGSHRSNAVPDLFYIAEEEYAIGILQMKEIIEYDIITKVPGTPPSIRAVINLCGSVVPVIDLGVKLVLLIVQSPSGRALSSWR